MSRRAFARYADCRMAMLDMFISYYLPVDISMPDAAADYVAASSALRVG